MLLVRICHLAALPNLQQALLGLNQTQNFVAQKQSETNDDVVNEILRNFEGAKLL